MSFIGVHGKLVDLCRPTQRRYDVAVATVLGRNMDSIVVEDQRTAIECIQVIPYAFFYDRYID